MGRSCLFFLIATIIFIFLVSNASAVACINLKLAKTLYLPKETVQVEVDADTVKDILFGDVFFYRNSVRLPISIFISKVTDTKYFLWFDLPVEPGEYTLRVRGTCKDGSLFVVSVPIKVKKTVALHYESLRSRVENKWPSLSLEEHILSAGVLSYAINESLESYRKRNDSCINQECNTRLNALTLIAFDDGLIRQRMQDALKDSQKKNYTNITNVSGCWGISLGEECDAEATAYALFSLAITGRLDKNDSMNIAGISWLSKNAFNIEEKAASYYLTKDPEMLTKLLNMQASEGWWSKNITSYEPDIRATSLAVFSLKSAGSNNSSILEAVERAESWLLEKNALGLSDEAFMLLFGLPSEKIEPLLAFWPGIVKTESAGAFDFILLNKGTTTIVLDTNLLNSTTSVELPMDSMKKVRFNIPQITTTDGRTIFENLVLDYRSKIAQEHYEYSVPVLIFTEKAAQEGINGTINASEEIINETDQEEIINETEEEWENKTTELNESLIQKRFYFVEKSYTKTSNLSEGPFTIKLRLENKLDKDISDVLITYSSSLIGLVERIEPSYIEEISKGVRESITLSITPTVARVYEGEITASAKYGAEKITTIMPITINIMGAPEKEKNCVELGGKICEEDEFCDETEGNITTAADTFSCCIPLEACKKKSTPGRTIGIIIVVVILIVLLIIFLLLRRKPKKEMKEFLEETAKQYEKRFQRPPSIRR